MTRKAWVMVRLPGDRTAPATNTSTRLQTGAVKQGRNTANQVARIAGASETTDGTAERIRLIAAVESSRSHRARVLPRSTGSRPDGGPIRPLSLASRYPAPSNQPLPIPKLRKVELRSQLT